MRTSLLAVFACLVTGMFCQAAPAQDVPRLTTPISLMDRSTLTGNVPAKLARATDEGPVQPEQVIGRMMLMLRPSAEQQAALEQLLAQQQDPASPNYHRWLTPEEFAARFGVGDADSQTLTSWLRSQGFTQIEVSRTHRFISFSGTATVTQNAFATQLHRVRLDGRSHIANITAPSVPRAIAGVVHAIVGLDDFPARSFQGGGGSPGTFTPAQFAATYDTVPLTGAGITGSGVTIVVVGQADPSLSDLQTFQNTFGLQRTSPQTILAPGSSDPGTNSASDVKEAALDLEWVSAIAPGATIVYDYATNAINQALVDAIDYDRGQIVSVSYGDCETNDPSGGAGTNLLYGIDGILQAGNAMGITIVAASGDQGAAACESANPLSNQANTGLAVNFPASDPSVTGVGGTELSTNFSTETAWNDAAGHLAASGGGESGIFQQPSWQSGNGVPFGVGYRYVPDVALNASITVTPYAIVTGGSPTTTGGTSAATAGWAAILALVQQFLAQDGIGSPRGLGNVNPVLYSLANLPQASQSVFHDITTGNNIVPCRSGVLGCGSSLTFGYSAGTGYDEVTGWGSVDTAHLATWWGYLEGTPRLSTSLSGYSFGNQPAATASDPITVTVTNNGNGLLSISGVTFAGTNPASFSLQNDTCVTNSPIIPGSSCTFSVAFQPTAGGQQSSLLSITSNVAGSPTLIALTGTGVAPVPSGTVTTTYPFNGSGVTGYGGGPIIQAADGNYYGVNAFGGSSVAQNLCPGAPTGVAGGCGTIYKISPTTGITVLYNFQGGSDGAYPSSLIQGPDGNLYGTALQGGIISQGGLTTECSTGCGTLFEIATNGTSLSSAYPFTKNNPSEGQNPSSLTLGADGNIYGTTLGGGTSSAGTVFAYTPGSAAPSTVYNFQGGAAGSYPQTLVQGSDGWFYGMTQETQVGDYGAVFKVNTSGSFQPLYPFQNQTDGANFKSPSSPVAHVIITQPSHAQTGTTIYNTYATPKALVQYSDGNFYGTTAAPPASPPPSYRSVFQITPAGVITTLYTFTGNPAADDGGGSYYGLTLGSDGNFYGTSGDVIFRMTSAGRLSSLYRFAPDLSGDPQPGYLLNAADGSFVDATTSSSGNGTQENGCSSNCGYVFDYIPSPPLSAPVQVSLSATTVAVNTPVVLNWQALQAYSLTSQQCYAFLSAASGSMISGGGTWAGKQNGTLAGNAYQGAATITPTLPGTYTYALTCGGTMSASATLTVSKINPIFVLSSSPSYYIGTSLPTLTATASNPSGTAPPPSGMVSFNNGYNGLGSSPLLGNGVATRAATKANAGSGNTYGSNIVEYYATYSGDSNFNSATATLVVPIASLVFSPPELPNGVVGQSYSAQLLGASGGTPPYTYTLYNLSLPPGLTLNQSSGTISGKPTTYGAFEFTIQVTDSLGATALNSLEYSPLEIDIASSISPLRLPAPPLTAGTVATFYNTYLEASGGVGPFTYQLTSGAFPMGLTFSNRSGQLTGTPTTNGTSTFTLEVTDSEIPAATVSQTYSLTIAPGPLSVTTTVLSGGAVNSAYSATLAATGGTSPFIWTVTSGSLPSGLSLSSGGVIAGAPTQAGTYSFTVQAKDQLQVTVTAALSITIYPVLVPITSSLPTAALGSGYTASLAVSGGKAPYTWRVASGTLPPGMLLASSTGVLSGTPTQSGAFTFIVLVSDSDLSPASSSFALTLNVNATALAITSPPVLPEATQLAPYSTTLGVAGGVPGYRWTVEPNTLPPGLQLDSNTGVISGTPTQAGATMFAVQVTDSEGTPVSVSKALCIGVNTPSCPLRFIPITPCRVVNTANAPGTFGGPALQGGMSREFDLPQGKCNIPASAMAYSFNVTVSPFTTLGYLTAYPSGQARPPVSTLNSIDGRVKANAVIVPAGVNGGVSLFATDETQAIIDVDGYFVPASDTSALEFYPLPPCRLVDTTQMVTGPLAGPALPGGSTRDFPITSGSCNIPPTAQAYSLNITAIPQVNSMGIKTLGYLTAFPTGQPQPLASNLNATTGTFTAVAAILPAGIGGDVSVFVTDRTDVLLDINGYFAPPGPNGLSLYTTTPCRMEYSYPIELLGTVSINGPSSSCALPSTAAAYVLNATVVPPGFFGFLTLWSGPTQPGVSTLNAIDGAVTNNMAIVPVSNGTFNAYLTNPANLILDISSYFAP